jgi:hypothetical protein
MHLVDAGLYSPESRQAYLPIFRPYNYLLTQLQQFPPAIYGKYTAGGKGK